MSNNQPPINHDGKLTIATGQSRKSTNWRNTSIKWSSLLSKLSETKHTNETFEEYKSLPKEQQDNIKDVGGFVGGTLRSERRRRDTVADRCLVSLDLDYAKPGLWEKLNSELSFAFCIYSTHKHSPEKPRLRLIIPLSRPVTPEEYEAVARKLAEEIGMDYFDPTSFEASRLMYWPSTSSDGVYEFQFKDEKWLDPGEVLGKYEDWRDITSWPNLKSEGETTKKHRGRQENPREKTGVVGAFCRTYSLEQAIEKFLGDAYTPSRVKNRYTYKRGTTTGGLVIYEGGDFAYSHHATDPAGGRLCNAFDLVRLHKFGELDERVKDGTPTTKLPSYNAMITLATEDEGVRLTLGEEKLRRASEDFEAVAQEEAEDNDWLSRAAYDKNGNLKATAGNIILILENDPNLKGKIGYNQFSHRTTMRESMPWHPLENKEAGDDWKDRDDAELRVYLERAYGISSFRKVEDCLKSIENKYRYHPIREYLKGLKWDGTPRVETLFIDYLGAEDTPYTRAVTRKTLTAAAARIFTPGVKFDHMLVLTGKEGVGKSSLMKKLGKTWFSDTVLNTNSKDSYEQVHAAWIIEFAELVGMKGEAAEIGKQFISKQEDMFRVSYGKRPENFKRQCVFFGSTNEIEFLRDIMGNRKFWPVKVAVNKRKYSVLKDMTEEEVDQVWAEACVLFRAGEELYLDEEMEKEAREVQDSFRETNPKEGMIREYLERLLPAEWEHMDLQARRRFIRGTDFGTSKGTVKRTRVCAVEIYAELFDGDINKMNQNISKEFNNILRTTPGWILYPYNRGRMKFGNFYGLQTAFIREDE